MTSAGFFFPVMHDAASAYPPRSAVCRVIDVAGVTVALRGCITLTGLTASALARRLHA